METRNDANPTIVIRAMTAEDYSVVSELWRHTEGMGLTESDSEQGISAHLRRNPGVSAVAISQHGDLVGAVLCGHDGRSGYIHHLAVELRYRRLGIAARLLEHCFVQLGAAGISRSKIFIFKDNEAAASFWNHNGWSPLSELLVLQKLVSSPE
jgi:ribosomal protein S18 acetylase RimI-like enzyme